ncbi:MAG: DUF3592 domain-containing protein [Sulfurihydrogenibium sp.]|jgi:hypothetical protein|nr:DUF3592 domain-containing protein [Sulfurihydrogenibium sp.]
MLKVFVAYVLFASVLTMFVIYKYFRFLFWKKTEGEILDKRVERVEEIIEYETYRPVVEYKYQVDGKEYMSNRIFITPFESDYNTAEKIINGFNDKKVVVYYNPSNPSESILKRNLHAGMVVMLIALIGIMLPFLYQAFVEVIGIGASKEDIAFFVKNLLHSLFDN